MHYISKKHFVFSECVILDKYIHILKKTIHAL